MALPDDVTNQSVDKSSEKPASSEKQKVGYRNPPIGTRFQKGRSGNPKGRPKRRKTLDRAVAQALNEKVWANENGKRKAITKLDACAKHLVNKAAGGDAKWMRLLLELNRLMRLEEASITKLGKQKHEDDLRLSEGLSARGRLRQATEIFRARIEARQAAEEENQS